MNEEILLLENKIIEIIEDRITSPSHGIEHLTDVKEYALQLQTIHGGNRKVLVVASLLHDLGRNTEDTAHGEKSREASVKMARQVLQQVNSDDSTPKLADHTIERVCAAIREHDQPEVTPSAVEGKILKDADFLAGFGARGIMRISMWTGESKWTQGSRRTMSDAVEKLEVAMPDRLDNLEFPESRRVALKEMSLVRQYTARYKNPYPIESREGRGRYIWIEGTSGSGKDTQARRLSRYISNRGDDVKTISEPHNLYDQLKSGLSKSISNKSRKWMFVADRQNLIDQTVRPLLGNGITVISIRSYISTLVHQCDTTEEAYKLSTVHSFVPCPDRVFLLDVTPGEAMRRIEERGEPIGTFEDIDSIRKHRHDYKTLCQELYKQETEIIDGEGTKKEVFERIKQKL